MGEAKLVNAYLEISRECQMCCPVSATRNMLGKRVSLSLSKNPSDFAAVRPDRLVTQR